MKRIFLVVASLLLSATASATTEKWTAGWYNFSEPLNFTSSNHVVRVGDHPQVDGYL